MNREVAVAVVSPSSPSVDRQAHPPLYRPGTLVTALVPFLLPIHQLRRLVQLLRENRGETAGHFDVFEEEIQRVHPKRRRKVVKGSHRNQSGLRMVRSAPGPLRPNVIRNRSILLPSVRDLEDVRQWRRTATLHAP